MEAIINSIRDAHDGRCVLTVEEAAAVLNVSRSHAYELAAAGELPIFRAGRSPRVIVHQLVEWMLTGGTAGPRPLEAKERPAPRRTRRRGSHTPAVQAGSSAAWAY